MAVAVTLAPPGPGKRGAWKNIGRFMNHRAEFLTALWQEYGDFVHFHIGPAPIYLVSDPELIKDILPNDKVFQKTNSTEFVKPVLGNGLLASRGDFHARQRRMIQPAFSNKRVASYAQTFTGLAQDLSNSWHDGQELDIADAMIRVAFEGNAIPLFGKVAADMKRRVDQSLDVLFPIINKTAKPSGKIAMMLPTLGNYRFYRARAKLNEIIFELVDDARRDPGDRADLLAMLVRAQDSEGDGSRMTPRELRDEVMTLMLAGHETTALGLMWTWYLLAQNPEPLARLQAELDAVLGGRLPTAEDFPRLEYLRRVLNEGMRIYPPSYLVDRTPIEDWHGGDYMIPKGEYVFTSQYVVHRHPKYFPDPMRFDPDRWAPEEAAKRPRYSYFPFGGGQRGCIGELFARHEMTLVLATLLQQWSPELIPGQKIGTAPVITLRPDKPIMIKVRKR